MLTLNQMNKLHLLILIVTSSTEKLADSEQERLFSEMDLMLDLSHPNIMTLEGICYMELKGMGKGTVPCIVMPFMENGSLLDYLKMKRNDLDLNKEDLNEDEDLDTVNIKP